MGRARRVAARAVRPFRRRSSPPSSSTGAVNARSVEQGGSRLRDRGASKLKKPHVYKRDSHQNLYDAVDFLRMLEVERLNEHLVERVRERLLDPAEQLRVGFLVSSASRWNADVLFDTLQRQNQFAPRIVLSAPQYRTHPRRRAAMYLDERRFFAEIDPGMIELYDPEANEVLPVEDLDFDVLFYEMPWGMKDYPRRMIGRSLNAYMHYGFMMMANHEMHYNIASFHSYLWAYFTQTEAHRRMHLQHDPSARSKLVVTGYPKLDVYHHEPPTGADVWEAAGGERSGRRRVIYAPHHSLGRDNLGMSTFPWTHDVMLRAALEDEDVQWVYKPHPTLRFSVEKNGVMTAAEYEAYEARWDAAPNATVFDSGRYFDLFRTSDALITCCGSFLAEYLPTGRPIIWLVSDTTVGLNAVGRRLATGFYEVRSATELTEVFQRVVLEGDDPLASRRKELIEELFPGDRSASEQVVEYLRDQLVPLP